eukprot:scaffold1308_cov246-Chaetoceros_neogracile.AAC.4
MPKKTPHPSLQGKKSINTAGSAVAKSRTGGMNNPGHIKNKLKRSEVYGKYLLEKKVAKRQKRILRAKEAEALGDDVPTPKQTPRTLENAREVEHTMVKQDDVEILGDEASDEFADYFADTDICEFAGKREFTHLMVLSEKSKVCNGMIISHLRRTGAAAGGDEQYKCAGPTAFFKVSNVILSTGVPNHGASTSHVPELVLNGFGTRLGNRVGRFLGSLFPHNAQFQGHQVATFHNQRDYIFKAKKVKKKTKARLQELGPRFTLKLRWIQEGTFDTQFGEYEWFHKRKEMDINRRKFHL